MNFKRYVVPRKRRNFGFSGIDAKGRVSPPARRDHIRVHRYGTAGSSVNPSGILTWDVSIIGTHPYSRLTAGITACEMRISEQPGELATRQGGGTFAGMHVSGESGKINDVYGKFDITAKTIVRAARKVLEASADR